VAEAGHGPPVLLLHGFPDSWRLWRHQLPALAKAGHRVIAPDLRGFGKTDRPAEAVDYKLRALVNDVVVCWMCSMWTGPRSSATTGARPWPGRWPGLCPRG
jgi:pimeloyl-ACP methyl ester carboxylesterase